MKIYKRLTVRHPNSDFIAVTETKQIQQTREGKIVLERLAELEDKIENGTLIELPCKLGDIVYEVIQGLPIQEWKITGIVYARTYGKNYVITAERLRDIAHWKFWREDFGKILFLTKSEAEKKLKKLNAGAK